jgi:hypothetical protein
MRLLREQLALALCGGAIFPIAFFFVTFFFGEAKRK